MKRYSWRDWIALIILWGPLLPFHAARTFLTEQQRYLIGEVVTAVGMALMFAGLILFGAYNSR